MNRIIFLFLVIIPFTVSAQETPDTCSFEVQDTMAHHDIGVNIGPLIWPLFTREKIRWYELTYVYSKGPKFAFRNKFSANFDAENQDQYHYGKFDQDIIVQTDSSHTKYEYFQTTGTTFKIYSSFEYTIDEGRFISFGGIGLVNGLIENRSYRERVHTDYFYIDYGAPEPLVYSETGREYAGEQSFYSYVFGICPYVGLKLPIGDHFSINGLISIEWNYNFANYRPYGKQESYFKSFDDFSEFPIAAELGVYFRI